MRRARSASPARASPTRSRQAIEAVEAAAVRQSRVQVAVRLRPLTGDETGRGEAAVVQAHENTATVVSGPGEADVQVFAFDQVFSPEATQLEVFSKCAAPLVEQLCDGFNCTVFAYGQTGSGKTHTMMGTAADPGITPRVCWYLFDRLGRQPGAAARVAVTYLQIYNEGVRDMLAPADADAPPLRVRCCPRRGTFVQNLSEHAVSSVSYTHLTLPTTPYV